jgi:hypothetical protein
MGEGDIIDECSESIDKPWLKKLVVLPSRVGKGQKLIYVHIYERFSVYKEASIVLLSSLNALILVLVHTEIYVCAFHLM